MSLTWRELREKINTIPTEYLDDNVRIFLEQEGEIVRVDDLSTAGELIDDIDDNIWSSTYPMLKAFW